MNRRRSLTIFAAFLGLATLLVTLLHTDQFRPPDKRPIDAYGEDALGHAILREVYDRIDVPVLVDREAVAERASGAVLFIEPSPYHPYGERMLDLQALLLYRRSRGLSSIVVLPKWDAETRDGSEVAVRVDKPYAMAVLDAAVPSGTTRLRREDIDIPETAQLRQWSVPSAHGDRRVVLQERQTLQLEDSSMEPLLGTRRSALVARYRAHRSEGAVIVVSDPDLLHNFNLHRGDHARIAEDLVAYAETDAVVIDEVLHGHGYPVTLPAALGAWPTRIVVVQALLLALLYAIAVARRFGPPRTPSRRAGVAPLVALAADAMAGTPSRARRLAAAYVCAVIANHADRFARVGVETNAAALLAEVMSERRSGRKVLELARAAHRLRRKVLATIGNKT